MATTTKAKRLTPGIRVLKPEGQHKRYRFQQQEVADGPFITIHSPEIETFNNLMLSGILSQSDVKGRIEAIRTALYLERDGRKDLDLILPGNVKIMNEFIKKVYTPTKLARMEDGSYESAVYYLQNGLKDLDNLPIDGAASPIQEKLDVKYKRQPNIHHKRVSALNRLRKFLILPPLLHLRKNAADVAFLTEKEVKSLIAKADSPYKELIGVAFYTGLRKGEIFGLKKSDIRSENTLNVARQIDEKGVERGLKNGKPPRKAFVLPGGMVWVKAWLEIKKDVNRHKPVSTVCQKLTGVRFHDLRHSYAVHLIGKGATLEWVAQSLGHSTEVCERYYAGYCLADDAITLMQKLVDL
jgi:integrase